MKREIIMTKDGSHSIGISQTNITFHSRYGAIQESKHVFIEAGFNQFRGQKPSIHILEMGFGTGLNVLLTLMEASRAKQTVYYETIEEFPLERELFEPLNYCWQLERPDLQTVFLQLHRCPWEQRLAITPFFSFKKIQAPFQTYTGNQSFDIIFYDAFAPQAQPELWTMENFVKISGLLRQNGLLVTYCSKGEVQRAMRAAGFTIEKLHGPPHKREIIRAVKN
jgi:tRNA U34 5-methylaminomethyl-2-thiouridine-forming methyltransferase MnmC